MVCKHAQYSFKHLTDVFRYTGTSLALLSFSTVYRVRFFSCAPPYSSDDPQHLSHYPTGLVTASLVVATNMDMGSNDTRGSQESRQ